MTELYIRERYEVNDGKITEAGKYRGQPWQAVAFHRLAMNGIYDYQQTFEDDPKVIYTFYLQIHDYTTYDIPLTYTRARLTVTPEQVILEFS